MPKGIFAGKRQKQHDVISNPVLRYTDAHARSDPQPNDATCRPPQPIAFHRPGTSGGRGSRRPAPELDLKPPHAEGLSLGNGLSAETIGIALGSPRLVESQTVSHVREYSHCSASEDKTRPGERSRWRKLGGLFKAKRAFTAPPKPFYQLRVDSDWPQDSRPSVDEPNTAPAREEGDIKDGWPFLQTDPADTRDGANENGPQLQVDIPNVELERYSVMFGGLLRKPSTKASTSRIAQTQELNPPPRPPKSPRPKSPTPSFTLFPATHTSKASKVLGTQNLPPGSPMVKSQRASEQLEPANPRQSHVRTASPVAISPGPRSDSLPGVFKFGQEASEAPAAQSRPRRTQKPLPGTPLIESEGVSDQPETDEREIHAPIPKPGPIAPGPRSDSLSALKRDQKPHQAPAVEEQRTKTPEQRAAQPTLKINTNVQSFRPRSKKSTPPSSGPQPQTRSTNLHTPKTHYSPSPSSPRMPLTDEPEPEPEPDAVPEDTEQQTNPTEERPTSEVPKIEVSVARSVSVSKSKKQALVPISRRTDTTTTVANNADETDKANERLVEQRARTPVVMDGEFGHRHGNSQDARIESV